MHCLLCTAVLPKYRVGPNRSREGCGDAAECVKMDIYDFSPGSLAGLQSPPPVRRPTPLLLPRETDARAQLPESDFDDDAGLFSLPALTTTTASVSLAK